MFFRKWVVEVYVYFWSLFDKIISSNGPYEQEDKSIDFSLDIVDNDSILFSLLGLILTKTLSLNIIIYWKIINKYWFRSVPSKISENSSVQPSTYWT